MEVKHWVTFSGTPAGILMVMFRSTRAMLILVAMMPKMKARKTRGAQVVQDDDGTTDLVGGHGHHDQVGHQGHKAVVEGHLIVAENLSPGVATLNTMNTPMKFMQAL